MVISKVKTIVGHSFKKSPPRTDYNPAKIPGGMMDENIIQFGPSSGNPADQASNVNAPHQHPSSAALYLAAAASHHPAAIAAMAAAAAAASSAPSNR